MGRPAAGATAAAATRASGAQLREVESRAQALGKIVALASELGIAELREVLCVLDGLVRPGKPRRQGRRAGVRRRSRRVERGEEVPDVAAHTRPPRQYSLEQLRALRSVAIDCDGPLGAKLLPAAVVAVPVAGSDGGRGGGDRGRERVLHPPARFVPYAVPGKGQGGDTVQLPHAQGCIGVNRQEHRDQKRPDTNASPSASASSAAAMPPAAGGSSASSPASTYPCGTAGTSAGGSAAVASAPSSVYDASLSAAARCKTCAQIVKCEKDERQSIEAHCFSQCNFSGSVTAASPANRWTRAPPR
eukprot:gene5814-biopygen4276